MRKGYIGIRKRKEGMRKEKRCAKREEEERV